MTLNRREFAIRVAAVGGGLALALEIPGFAGGDGAAATGFQPNAWLRILPDGAIVFVLDRVEMGQGTMTSLPMILAEELGVSPEDLVIELAPAARAYVNPNLAMQMTGGSTSVAAAWDPLRTAGATARAMLIQAAARSWGVAATECSTNQKIVYHAGTGKTATYGSLAAAAATLEVPDKVKLRDPKAYTVIGKARKRLDAEAKATGRAGFGIDVQIPGMRIAVVKRSPVFGGRLKSFESKAALAMPGVEAVVEIPSGVAVVAKRYWQAKAAAAELKCEWHASPHQDLSSAAILADFAAAARSRAKTLAEAGDAAKAFDKAAKTVSAQYTVPYLAHAAMEPGNCTAHVTDDGCEVWAPTQGPGLAQQLAAEITGFSRDKVRIHTTLIGGGFGRRLYQDFVVEAVELARRVKYPVKIQWSREDDIQHDFYRPASVHELKGAVDGDGNVTAWVQAVGAQSIIAQCLGDWIRAIEPAWVPQSIKQMSGLAATGILKALGQDPSATEGAEDMDYGIPARSVEFVSREQPIPVGFWRSVGHSYTGFVVESFVDELAHAAGADPVAFRRNLLKSKAKPLAVLDLCVEKAGWGQPLPAGVFRGVAVHTAFGSCAAQVVEASVGKDGGIKVHRVVCAIDCGRVINPDGVEAQIAGGIVFALSAALYGNITVKDGGIEQSNFHDYAVLRMPDMPKIEVHTVPSEAAPTGVGEPGVPPLAAALANAVFAATGKRLRSLPLKIT